MAGREKFGPLSKPDFDILLQALSSTTKGRQFLEEYRRRCQPAEIVGLLNSLSQIESTFGTVRDQLQPERMADELRHISMTLDIAIDGAPIDPDGDDIARRFALCDRARQELAALANSLSGDSASDLGEGT
jgi:hypothetical protein